MAYSTPFTAVAGTAWKAADWNTYGRDNIAWIATDSPCCRVYRSTVQSLTSGAYSTLTFDSERFDNAAMHSTSSNTSRLTAPTGGGGKYLFGAVLYVAASAGGTARFAYLSYNGGASEMSITHMPFSATMGNTYCTPMTAFALSAADYAETHVTQDSGGALNCGGPISTGPEMFAFWFRN